MKEIKIPIIPHKQTFVKIKEEPHKLDYKAICVFTALGFFLDTDTYWLDTKVLPPGTINKIDTEGYWVSSKKWFHWFNKPKSITFEESVEEFATLFHKIIEEQVLDKKVILPLSGGLDSRTQATALRYLNKTVTSYSYSFENGFNESDISRRIAKLSKFEFQEYKIQYGYLWKEIEKLSKINNCYSEFTHPRQMGVINELQKLNGDIFSLGHWGDVLFDSEDLNERVNDTELVKILLEKIVKKSGVELASILWKEWNLEGDFNNYLKNRIAKLVENINIKNTNSKIRAFKSLYWAPRWTSVNLSVFKDIAPVSLPYYDDKMCQFICSLPETYLINRRIQIAYIKKYNKDLAKIVWQDVRPFNLYNYHLHKFPYNFPYRVFSKIKRVWSEVLGKKFIERNWELQFLGEENEKKVEDCFNEANRLKWISKEVTTSFINKFKHEKVFYSHSISILLTLTMFYKNTFFEKKNGLNS